MAKAKYSRQKNGYFQARVWDGTYQGTQKHYVTIRSKKSSKDLEVKVQQYNDRINGLREVVNQNILFGDFAQKWLTIYKADLAKRTQLGYAQIISAHFKMIADIKLVDILPLHYQLIQNESAGKKGTQCQIRSCFYQIMKAAVHERLYPMNLYMDLLDAMPYIKYKPAEKRPLTINEKNAIAAADLSPSDRIFIDLLYGTGIRRGEALALSRFDIDFSKGEININKSLAFDRDGSPYIKEPKTKNGYRKVPIPQAISVELENYVKNEISGTQLFTNRNGSLVSHSGYKSMWRRILKKLNKVSAEPIIGLTAHTFRHNYCSALCYQIPKISVKRIAALLGDNEKMVLSVYNHILMEKEDAEGAISAALF